MEGPYQRGPLLSHLHGPALFEAVSHVAYHPGQAGTVGYYRGYYRDTGTVDEAAYIAKLRGM